MPALYVACCTFQTLHFSCFTALRPLEIAACSVFNGLLATFCLLVFFSFSWKLKARTIQTQIVGETCLPAGDHLTWRGETCEWSSSSKEQANAAGLPSPDALRLEHSEKSCTLQHQLVR